MSKKSTVLRNTFAEEARIAEGIAADGDTFVPSDAEWASVYGRDAERSKELGRTMSKSNSSLTHKRSRRIIAGKTPRKTPAKRA